MKVGVKLAEEALKESEEKFSKAFHSNPHPMSIVTLAEGYYLDVNDSYVQTFGFSREELLGRTSVGIGIIKNDGIRRKILQSLKKKQAIKNLELELHTRSGRKVDALLSGDKIEIGEQACLLSVIIDITERKRTEEALQKRTHDFGERVKELNCLYGISNLNAKQDISLEEIYHGVIALIPPAWQYPKVTCSRIILEGQEFRSDNFRETVWKQATDIFVQSTRIGTLEVFYLKEKPEMDEGPFLKEERSLINTIAIELGSVIERKRMEQQLEKFTHSLENAYQELKELDQMKDSFLSTVSHELRTPLTSIKSFAEILLSYEGEDKETQKEFLTIINDESDRLTRLINDVLDISRIEAGLMQWEMIKLAIPEVIETAMDATHALFAQKSLKEDVDLEADLPPVWGDRDKLVQVITNLLGNAIKFTPDGGNIRVKAQVLKGSEVEDVSDMIRISVSDTGIGIAPEEKEKIFQKFKQVGDTLTDKPKGTGLGLPISKEIVEHYGGRIWVESDLGKGSTFYFTLPVMEKIDVEVPAVKEERAEVSPRVGKTILVVDDEANVRRFLSYELTKRGYRVIEASNGTETIGLVRKHHPDLITLDVLMPDIDGFDVTTLLKSDPNTKDIPILILSVVEDKEKGYKLGANDYLTKPLDTKVLMNKIARLLSGEKKKALVVDDDKSLVKAIKFELEKKGFSVHVAYDGKEALKVVESHLPDIIILDIVMPKMDGYEVMRVLKGKPDTSNIPIIVLTGVEIDGGRVKALSLGATEYVTKSGGLSKLFEDIEGILGGKSTD